MVDGWLREKEDERGIKDLSCLGLTETKYSVESQIGYQV